MSGSSRDTCEDMEHPAVPSPAGALVPRAPQGSATLSHPAFNSSERSPGTAASWRKPPEHEQPNQGAGRRWTSNHNQPALENKSPPACTKLLHELWEMHLGGNSLHMGINQERTPALTQLIPVSPSSTFAISPVGQEGSCPGAGAASKAIHGLHPQGSRAAATWKHGQRSLPCRKSWNLGINSKEEAPFSFCCSPEQSHPTFQDDSEILPVLFCLRK